MGPAGTEGTDGDATTGGRRSEPYAGSGPAEMAGPPATGAAGLDHELPVMTVGAAGATPPLVVGAGAAGGVASTGGLAAMNAGPAGMVGATGGVAWAGWAAPGSSPCNGPPANDGPPPAPSCPGWIPGVVGPPIPAGIPCPKPAGGEFPQDPVCIPGDIGPPVAGICMPWGSAAGCAGGTGPELPAAPGLIAGDGDPPWPVA
jgi:hypothetical protein